MLNVRATPIIGHIASCLAGKYQQLYLVINTSLLMMTLVNISPICQTNQKSCHDEKSRELPPLMVNQTVRVYNTDKKRWFIGKILSKEDERSYKIITKSGQILFRNRFHVRSMVLPEYNTQRSIYKNGDQPTDNNVTSDVPDIPSPNILCHNLQMS